MTLWEIYNGGKVPYPGIEMAELSFKLEKGYRMKKPQNSACTEEMYVTSIYRRVKGKGGREGEREEEGDKFEKLCLGIQ